MTPQKFLKVQKCYSLILLPGFRPTQQIKITSKKKKKENRD